MSKLEALRLWVRNEKEWSWSDNHCDDYINTMSPVAIIQAFDFIWKNPWVVE